MIQSVRPARFETDGQEFLDVLQLNLPHRQHRRFFEWLYRANPAGQARAWVATDVATSRIIGIASAFPRHVDCGGVEARGYILGDFCINPPYRSVGLALALQRACLEGLSTSDADFAVDFPSRSMMAVYQRLRIPASESVVRHAKPLCIDRHVGGLITVPLLARGVAAVANAWLRICDRAAHRGGPWNTGVEEGPWGEEFTAVARKWSPPGAISVTRTAQYLQWRYAQHPQQQYHMITARRAKRLGGYLVCHAAGPACVVDDLLAEDDSACKALLVEAIARGRREGLESISSPWPPADPGTRVLQGCGFRPRESSPVVLLPFARSAGFWNAQSSSGWYLSHGDWDS